MTDQINTGGAAFPQLEVVSGERDGHGDAIEAYTIATGGMTLRDYFAAKALQGMHASLADSVNWPDGDGVKKIAEVAYSQADAMIAARGGAQ